MFLRLKLLSLNIGSAILLIFFLCLGSQNLSKKHTVNLLISKTVPLPNGFLAGASFTLGFLSGGLTSVLMINDKTSE